jgi:hypothetical protein
MGYADERDQSTMDDFFDQEIDQGELQSLIDEADAEWAEFEESRRAPEGHYLTVTPYPVKRDVREVKVLDSYGEIITIKRGRYNFFGDTVNEETEKKYKLGFDMTPKKLYVIFQGAGQPPTYYSEKVDGSRLDPASSNYIKAAKLYEEVYGQAPKRYDEVEEFITETQLKLTVKKFKSGKSGVVGFELA